MATMKKTKKTRPTQDQIDDAVVAQANDDSAWHSSVAAKRSGTAQFRLPAALAARAAFLARLHHKANAEEWLRSVIEERVGFEESAFAGLKHSLAK